MELNQGINDFWNQNFLKDKIMELRNKFSKIVIELNNLSRKEFIEFKISDSNELKYAFLEIMNDIKSNLIKMDYESRINLLIELLQFQFDLSNIDSYANSDKIHSLESSILKNQYIINEIVSCWSNEEFLTEEFLTENSSVEAIEGVIGDLAGTYNCSKKLLKFLVQTLCSLYKHLNPTMILETHIRTRGDEGFVFSYVVERLLEASGTKSLTSLEAKILTSSQSIISDSDWNILLEVAEAQDSEDIVEYIKEQIKRQNSKTSGTSSLALIPTKSQKNLKKPKWILNSEIKDFVPSKASKEVRDFVSESSKGILDLESELDKYLKPENQEESSNEVRSKASNDVPIAPLTRNEVIKNFKALGFHNILRDTKNYDELIRHYGPINEIEGVECSSHPRNFVSNKVGNKVSDSEVSSFPCQMLYCMCREIDELRCEDFPTELLSEALGNDNPEISSETSLESSILWFKGYCEECHCKIPKKEYAVRFPVDGGGWIGCFCGFSCMKSSEIRPMYKSDVHRMNEVHNILREIGIYDNLGDRI